MKLNIELELEGDEAEDFVNKLALLMKLGQSSTKKAMPPKKQKKKVAKKATVPAKTEADLKPHGKVRKAVDKYVKRKPHGRPPKVPIQVFCAEWEHATSLKKLTKKLRKNWQWPQNQTQLVKRADNLRKQWNIPLKKFE